jgi:hypothetical protein
MAARYRIDVEQRLVITELWDACTDADLADVYRALRADPAFVPTFDELLDLRRVRDFVAAGCNVRHAGATVYAPGVRRAVLATPGLLYGMARMFESGAESHGHFVEILATPDEAEAWLGRPLGTSGLAARGDG